LVGGVAGGVRGENSKKKRGGVGFKTRKMKGRRLQKQEKSVETQKGVNGDLSSGVGRVGLLLG